MQITSKTTGPIPDQSRISKGYQFEKKLTWLLVTGGLISILKDNIM